MSPDQPPRITEGERDTAVERLKEAFAEGHLSSEEMDERLHVAPSATTPGELTPALATLPDKDAGRTVVIDAVSGRIKRGLGWRVPRILKVHSRHGRQDGPRIRIIGTMGYGRLTIKHSRR
jgi:hypothetical protein